MADNYASLGDLVMDTVIWPCLANAEAAFGRLDAETKQKAINCLELGESRKIWGAESKLTKEWQHIEKFHRQLLLEMEKPQVEKKIRQPYHCPWKKGDVFYWKCGGELAQTSGLCGRYILFQKVGEFVFSDNWETLPVMFVKFTDSEQLPKKWEEYGSLKFIIPKGRWNDKIWEPVFRCVPCISSKRMIPKEFTFLENMPEWLPPIDECSDKPTEFLAMKRVEDVVLRSYLFHGSRW